MSKTVKVTISAAAVLLVVVSGAVLANKAHDIIVKMSDQDRNKTFAKFLRNSGESCDVVTRNFFQGFDKSGAAYWNVACANKKAYVISIYNDARGSTKILSCAVLKAIKAGECFKKF